ncbi:MAG: 5'-deoxynucleotidase [Oscillospiraceae bacterium]|nr:5'-deoxynucleotidase [Oscillospiraceae bacterium]
MANGFFALLSRMRFIGRWGLMRSSIPENVQEHSHETAVYAHALGLIRREVFHRPCDAERLAVLALYHDASETLTGDLPTPVKYYDRRIRAAYKEVERQAEEKLLTLLPTELRGAYADILRPAETDAELWQLVKAADKLSALTKCIAERKAGNLEFLSAEAATLAAIEKMALPEAAWFLSHCIPAYELNLDELGTMEHD